MFDDQLPSRDLERTAVILTGPPLSAKTATARAISNYFSAGLIESACLGRFPPRPDDADRDMLAAHEGQLEQVRRHRHYLMLQLCKAYMKTGKSFVVDSGFGSRVRRNAVLALVTGATEAGATLAYTGCLVYCHCKDDSLRVWRRFHRKWDPFSSEPSLIDDEYLRNVGEQFSAPEVVRSPSGPKSGEYVDIVEFDSAASKVTVLPSSGAPTQATQSIATLIQYLAAIGRL